MIELREATRADAAGIARVHVRAWQDGYAGHIDPAYLDGLSVDERTAMWRDVWFAQPNEGSRLVATVDGEIVGFVVGTRASPSVGGCGEIFSIYVDPAHWGTGAGSRLLRAATAEIRADDGPHSLVLWVLDGNRRAIDFYEAHGWCFDGATKDETVGDQLVPHVRYRIG